jgi:hypothetical protein
MMFEIDDTAKAQPDKNALSQQRMFIANIQMAVEVEPS